MASASCANTGLPVSIMSRALDRPMSAGRRTVPPSISGTPIVQQIKLHVKYELAQPYLASSPRPLSPKKVS